MEDQRIKCLVLGVLCGKVHRPVDIDTGTLIFVCALWHKEVYNEGG